MAQMVDTREYLDMVCGLLEQGQTSVPVPVAGSSMTPFLHHGDTVYLDLPKVPLKKADILLYLRPNGSYVLHRIVQVNEDGSLIMMGDAQQVPEWIEGSQVRGVVTAVRHKEKLLTSESPRWRFFATAWLKVIPARRKIMTAIGKVKKATR